MDTPILAVEDLVTTFETEDGPATVVDSVSFELRAGRTLAVVGESGCGKSVTSLSIMGLLPESGRVARGRIVYSGRNLVELSERELRAVRGREIAMIFQDPSSSLNPVFTVGTQIEESLRTHLRMNGTAARARTIELLEQVGIPAPHERIDAYPHQLSGGMRQRVMIAIAIACEPKILIADEPTTALDVTVQAQILDLLKQVQRARRMALMLITHDLGVVSELADDVAVMYAGRIVEYGERSAFLERPAHPYTRGLLRSVPSVHVTAGENATLVHRLPTIPGMVPDLRALSSGCRFGPRCPHVRDSCREREPSLMAIGASHHAACVRWAELPSSAEDQSLGAA
jgi:peptide/nickel transport system ATP-binding protein